MIRKIAPSRARATASFHHGTSRWSGSGGSSSSTTPQAKSKTFFDRNPAMKPPAMLNGMKRSLPMLCLLGLVLGRGAWLHRDRPVLGYAALELAPALDLGVHLGAEQHGAVRDPQPDQEHDHACEAPVGRVIGAEVRNVESESSRRDHPDQDGQDPSRRDPPES